MSPVRSNLFGSSAGGGYTRQRWTIQESLRRTAMNIHRLLAVVAFGIAGALLG
jgi:hypothetical protein